MKCRTRRLVQVFMWLPIVPLNDSFKQWLSLVLNILVHLQQCHQAFIFIDDHTYLRLHYH